MWTYDRVVEIAKGMEAKVLTGFRVSAATAPLVIDALKHYARDRFAERDRPYTVDIWAADDSRVERHYAEASDLFAACDAFARAARQNPKALITLRQGIRVVQSTERRR